MMFQFNHRAKLLGSFTNGTGGAFFEWQPFTGVHWSDRYEVIRINIPNYLVGKPGRPGVNIFPDPKAYLTYNHENLPLQADHYYAETLEDYLKRSTGWFRTATNVLVKPLKTFESH
jgi:hypothetical protein